MKKFILPILLCGFSFSSQAQLINGGVETWRTYSAGLPSPTNLEAPDGWFGVDSLVYTYSAVLSGTTPQQLLFKENGAHGGSFAVRLATTNIGGGITIPGILANANPSFDVVGYLSDPNPVIANYLNYSGGTSVSQRINTLTAWVKYFPVSNDAGLIGINAVKTGAGAGGTDSVIGTGTLVISATSAYTLVTVPLTYTDASSIPDRVDIVFQASDISGNPQDGSEMYIDDIAISTAMSVKDVYQGAQFAEIFPNPATDLLNIKSSNQNELVLKIFGVNGTLSSYSTFKGGTAVSVNNLPSGLYFYELVDLREKKTQRGKFSKN